MAGGIQRGLLARLRSNPAALPGPDAGGIHKANTYLATGGHRTEDARNNAIRCIRLRVRPDYSGIDLLPAPNRDRARLKNRD